MGIPNVILLIPEHWSGGDKNLDAVVYTAITRTLQNLIVINCNERYNDFGESLGSDESVEEDLIEEYNEYEIEEWMETLPFPLASILWASFSSLNYEHKVDYLMDFFEAFSEFVVTILLSGLLSDKDFFQEDVSSIFNNMEEHSRDWYEKPSFGTWNYLGKELSKIIKNQLKDSYHKNQCLKSFGQVEPELLEALSCWELHQIFWKVSNLRNDWKHSVSHVSEEQYQTRFQILENYIYQVYKIIGTTFRRINMVLPIQNHLNDGVHHYTVERYMTSRAPFRQIVIESNSLMDNSKIYLTNINKNSNLELISIIINVDNSCYFYNGKDYHTGLARYCSYHNSKEPELLLPMEKLGSFISMVNGVF